ncbi:MAG: HD domain-containing protein [Candidatus Absconditabacterales bacterium]|nr:HD domain-containing protein [Candidatus Absconditabacterales bacterium]
MTAFLTEQQAIDQFYGAIEHYPRFAQHKSLIYTAVNFAQKAHQGQERKLTGEPYLTHPLAVATMVAHRVDDYEAVLGAILHDTVEDSPPITLDMIYDTFGSRVGFMVDAVTDATHYYLKHKDILCQDKIEKILAGGLRDIAIFLIKLADREHNLTTIDGLDPKKQVRMSFESQAIYVPLKQIIQYNDNPKPLTYYIDQLNKFCATHAITDYPSFKSYLMNVMYRDFDDQTYLFTYSHSHRVLWTIENKALFYGMIEEDAFANAIDIVRMEQIYEGHFFVEFLFTKASGSEALSLDLGGITSVE